MSVNAINAADQQPQRKSSPIVPAVGAGVATGLAGAGATYLWGGGKYVPTLPEILEKDKVEFESTMKKATDAEKKAEDIKAVEDAYQKVATETAGKQGELKAAQTNYDLKVAEMKDPDGVTDGPISKAKADLDEANKQKEVRKFKADGSVDEGTSKMKPSEMKDQIKTLEERIKTASEADKENLNKQLEAIKNEYKPHIDAFDAKNKALTEAKESRLKAIAAEVAESEEKQVLDTLDNAKKNLNEARKNAIKNLGEDATKAFDNIKGALKEIKWGKIGMWGGIAAAVGLVAGYILGGSKNDVA